MSASPEDILYGDSNPFSFKTARAAPDRITAKVPEKIDNLGPAASLHRTGRESNAMEKSCRPRRRPNQRAEQAPMMTRPTKFIGTIWISISFFKLKLLRMANYAAPKFSGRLSTNQ